ncbi:MAG: hypothetical protein AMXMBFR53_21130 [Gemmatimonadota bacterium]
MSSTRDSEALPDALLSLPHAVHVGLEMVAARRLDNPEDVREAVQETLARTVAAALQGKIPEDVALGAYAGGVLRHVVADKLRDLERRRGNGVPVDPDDLPAPHPDPLQRLVAGERVELLRQALRRIPSQERRLLRRIFVEGERVADIARRAGEPAERIRQRKFRALRRLRELMGEAGPVTMDAHRRQEGHDDG